LAKIEVNDLCDRQIVGVELFEDSESFLHNLSDRELNLNGGLGGTPLSHIIITHVPD
jgi:hypothetical protein